MIVNRKFNTYLYIKYHLMPDKKLKIIGRKEIANLNEFELYHVPVKIDSGAYTSSIDVVSIQKENDRLCVQFVKNGKFFFFDTYKTKRIKSSNGAIDERFIIDGEIELGDVTYKTPFSLSDRSGMRSPILLGRKLLNGNFVIDTSKVKLLKNSTI